MAKVTFNTDKCKGCYLCTTVCPKKIVLVADQLNSRGFKPVHVPEQDKCIGCAFCATICPDTVIIVEK